MVDKRSNADNNTKLMFSRPALRGDLADTPANNHNFKEKNHENRQNEC